MSSQFVSTALPEAVGVIWKTAFFCLLFKSPLVTWFRVVLHYLRAVTHLQPAHTDAPLYKIGSSPTQNLFHSFPFSPKQARPNRLRFRNKEELFYAVRDKIPDSQFEFSLNNP